jgi:tripartite-type tricarboxylate transporter receptor subunit TctC
MFSFPYARLGLAALAGAAVTAGSIDTAKAVDFKGKTIKVVIGYAAGGGYDRYGRQVARHIGRHLPGKPTVVAQNRPGAGSYKTVNYLYSQAPKDGTVFGIFARSVPILAFSGKSKQANIDPNKLTWIGTSSSYKGESYLMVVRKDSGIKSIADMQNAKKPLNFAATSFGSDGTDVPIVLKDILRINVQPLRGYPGGNTLYLAVERGEAQARMVGYASMRTAMPHWLDPKKTPVRVVLQFATKTRLPAFPDAPTAREIVTNQADRDLIELLEAPFFMARPFAAPPGLKPDVTKVLRDAFMAAHADPLYKAEAKKVRLLTSPVHGAEVQKLVASLGKKPRALYDRYTKLLANPKSPVRKVNWQIVTGTITKVNKRGSKFSIKVDGKVQAGRMRGRYTKSKINGKKASRKKIKPGMTCKIWWEGPKSYAGRMDCKS